jgi:nucleotide-binding universal stress UspA family protein
MYERVLVPLDGSDVAEGVLPFAEKVAGPLDAEVVLVRVVEPLSPADAMASAGVAIPDTLFLRELHAKEYLTSMARRLQAKGLRVRTALRVGVPAAEIVGAAVDEGADLIAMTTHGRSGLRRVLFGSVAESVLRSAEIPVLMMRLAAKAAPIEA